MILTNLVSALVGFVVAVNGQSEQVPFEQSNSVEQEFLAAQTKLMNEESPLALASHRHTCDFAHKRIWNGAEDYQAILDGEGGYSGQFIDEGFPVTDALYWADARAQSWRRLKERVTNQVRFRRISQYFQKSKGYSMWGQTGINPGDVNQGAIGNCWFMVSQAAHSKQPERIKSIFLTEQLNNKGIYAVRLFALGVPVSVHVDDFIPLNSSGKPIFAELPTDKALWPIILEKAFSKLHGNYESIVAGMPADGINNLSGSPGTDYEHSQNSKQEIFQHLTDAVANKDMISAGTAGSGNDQVLNKLGLSESHAYNILDFVRLSNGVYLVKVRNPWGSENYHGPWSDKDGRWTDALRQEVGSTDNNDGFFFIDFDSYYAGFEGTYVNENIDNLKLSYFLVKNDKSLRNSQYRWSYGSATRHMFTLTSDTTQTLKLSAHTWGSRSYPDKCSDATNAKHSVYRQNSNTYVSTFWSGQRMLPKFTIQAGESIQIATEFQWATNGITKDFSLSIWGDSQVNISSDEGLSSTSFDAHKGEYKSTYGGSDYDYEDAVDADVIDNDDEPAPPAPPAPTQDDSKLYRDWHNSQYVPNGSACQFSSSFGEIREGFVGAFIGTARACNFNIYFYLSMSPQYLQYAKTYMGNALSTRTESNGWFTLEFLHNQSYQRSSVSFYTQSVSSDNVSISYSTSRR